MVEHDPQPGVAKPLHDFAVGRIDAVIGDALVVEWRQHHHGIDADRERVTRQRHRFAERRDAGSGQQPARRDAGLYHRLEQRGAFGGREGVGLAGGAEQRDAIAALAQEVAAMRDKARVIGGELGVERRQRRTEHAMRMQGRC